MTRTQRGPSRTGRPGNSRPGSSRPGSSRPGSSRSVGRRSRRDGRRAEAGQSIVLAVIVLFLLMFLGGVFIAVLRRNMTRTELHVDALNAQQLAEAGINFVNSQLSTTVDGADWRPTPATPPAALSLGAGCTESAPPGENIDPKDPDYKWLRGWAATESGTPHVIQDTRAPIVDSVTHITTYPTITVYDRGPTGGFTRVDYGGGRYLIRVVYNPNNDPAVGPTAPDMAKPNEPSPLSKFIRIDSVGREGIVDPNDPTTYTQQSLRRELVAFKPITLVDYVRFITDRQHSGEAFTLGASRFPLIAGAASDADAVNDGVPGRFFSAEDPPTPQQPGHVHNLDTIYGPVRSNGGLRIKGGPMIALDETPVARPGGVGGMTADPTRGDKIEVVNDIERVPADPRDPNDTSNLIVLAPNVAPARPLWSGPTGNNLDAGITQSGLVATGVNRIEPPDLGAIDPESHIARYRLLTRYSTTGLPGLTPIQSEVAARNGLGGGIYIDNQDQRQSDNGRYSLVEDWMNPANNVTSNWTGHIYNPPGVHIQLLPYPVKLVPGSLVDGKEVTEGAGVTFPNGLVRITRSDRTWRIPDPKSPDSRAGIDTGRFTEYFQYPLALGEKPPLANYPPAFTNGVIYAEGNIRVWGKLPPDRQNSCPENSGDTAIGQRLTIVSGGTIYVEGSLLKGDALGGSTAPDAPRRSGLALLAQDYVTVNTTAYFAVPPETNSGDWSFFAGNWYNTLYLPPQDRYSFYILNGVDVGAYYPTDTKSAYSAPRGAGPLEGGGGVQQELYTQASGESTPGAGVALQVNGNRDGTPFYHPWWQVTPNAPQGHFLPGKQWTYEATPLYPALGSHWSTNSQIPNWLQFTWRALTPAWISKTAVAPLDVRIEAAMYAMNGSFFVIPGVPFNSDPDDTRASFFSGVAAGGHGQRHGGLQRLRSESPFPFAQEPLDIKLTIVGAITENRPAPENAQEAWSRLWGWTPLKKPSGAAAAHGGDGLTYQFDPELRAARRFDVYGRPLPLMPRLPVSPDLVYYGEAQSPS